MGKKSKERAILLEEGRNLHEKEKKRKEAEDKRIAGRRVLSIAEQRARQERPFISGPTEAEKNSCYYIKPRNGYQRYSEWSFREVNDRESRKEHCTGADSCLLLRKDIRDQAHGGKMEAVIITPCRWANQQPRFRGNGIPWWESRK